MLAALNIGYVVFLLCYSTWLSGEVVHPDKVHSAMFFGRKHFVRSVSERREMTRRYFNKVGACTWSGPATNSACAVACIDLGVIVCLFVCYTVFSVAMTTRVLYITYCMQCLYNIMVQASSMQQYQGRVKRLLKRERKTTRKLKELGIEYDFPQYVSCWCGLNESLMWAHMCLCL